jgi:hypothetical protein
VITFRYPPMDAFAERLAGNFNATHRELENWESLRWLEGWGGVTLDLGITSQCLLGLSKGMDMTECGKQFSRLSLLLLFSSTIGRGQAPAPPAQSQDQGAAPTARLTQRPEDGRALPLFGKITAINKGSLELAKPDGSTATVKLTDKTEYRRDRQGAKLGDFKVGDMVFVRGEENADHSVTAQLIGGRSGAGPEGGTRVFGEMGKDFIVGEVKSVDAPKLTVLRPDNVTQTLELNEETSLRRGRESITMADIQPGDHVVVRGAVENNVFVPKNVMLFSPEQWKQMEEMRKMSGTGPAGPVGGKPASAPKSNPPQR